MNNMNGNKERDCVSIPYSQKIFNLSYQHLEVIDLQKYDRLVCIP